MKKYCFALSCLLACASSSLMAQLNPNSTKIVRSATPTVTTETSLTVTADGSPVSSVPSSTVVTLTATVQAGGKAVKAGQVSFCDASVPFCTDIHLLASTPLTSQGTATYKFRPGPGNHIYNAFYADTQNRLRSVSGGSTLSVNATGTYATSVSVAATSPSNVPNNYTLTATVLSRGPASPKATGTVSFFDYNHGNANIGSAPLAQAQTIVNLGGIISAGSTLDTDLNPLSVASGDFNGDGINDLAVTSSLNSTDVVTIYLGNGDGSFTTGTSPSGGGFITAGDFNNDGKSDLLLVNSSVSVLLGQGDGTFIAAPGSSITGVFGQPPAVGDFNRDGILDVAIPSSSTKTMMILLGNGDGSFAAAPVTQPTYSTDSSAQSVAEGDINGDGYIDLVLGLAPPGNSGSNSLAILLGNGDGTFTLGAAAPLTGYIVNSLQIGDFNGDGRLDVVVASTHQPNSIVILLGQPNGLFASPQPLPDGSFAIGYPTLAEGDFDGDGVLDIAVVYSGVSPNTYPGNPYEIPSYATILRGNGDGTFVKSGSGQAGYGSNAIVATDFTGNGVSNLAICNRLGSTSPNPYIQSPQENGTVSILIPALGQTATLTGYMPTVSGTHQIQSFYSGDGYYRGSEAGDIYVAGPIGAPVFTPAGGTYSGPQSVTLSSSDTFAGQTFYYTTDGTVPTTSSTLYTGPISVQGSETIQAIATYPRFANSSIASATYQIQPLVASPTFGGVMPKSYPSAVSVVLRATTPGSTIYYTTDGSVPTTASIPYSGPIQVSATTTINAIAAKTGYSNSPVLSGTFVIQVPAATPVISPAGGVFGAVQLLTITAATPGSAIYYTTDGTAPTAGSKRYGGPIVVSTAQTVQAIATVAGYLHSAVASQSYVVVGSPTALAYPATAVDTPKATLHAIVNTQGVVGSYTFRYGTSPTALTLSTKAAALSATTNPVTVNAALTTLGSGTTYYFQVVVMTSGGTATSAIQSFTTN